MYPNTKYQAIYWQVYRIIGDLTPLNEDCGQLCGKACCKGSKSTGMLLFPREETALDVSQFNIIPSKQGLIAVCDGTCERANRPLSCRIFPFFPRLFDDDIIRVVYDTRSIKLCPITAYSDLVKPDRQFLRAVRHAGRLLAGYPECRSFLKAVSKQLGDLNRFKPINFEGIAARIR